jgi:hypothetical protein
MKRKSLLIAWVALLVIAIAATSFASASGRSAASLAGPEDAPTPNAPGFYLVGSKSLDPALFHHAGEMQFFSWAELHVGPSSFDWYRIDNYIETHYQPEGPGQPGKRVGISITPYDGRAGFGAFQMPEWVRNLENTTLTGVETNEIRNGTFDGSDNWTTSGTVTINGTAQLGGVTDDTATVLQYEVAIPYVLAAGEFTFRWRSQAAAADPDDVFTVELLDRESGEVVAQLAQINNLGTRDWQPFTLDLANYAGNIKPTLRFKLTNDETNPTTVWIDDVEVNVQPLLPKIWDPAYLSIYQDFVMALGNRYRNDDRVEFIGIGTGQYGETRASDPKDKDATRANGLPDSASWTNTVNIITNMYIQAFSQGSRIQKVLLLQNAPFQYSTEERRDFSNWAADRDVGLSFNGLYYDFNSAESWQWFNCGATCGKMAYDSLIKYWDDVPIAFEAYGYMVGDRAGNNDNPPIGESQSDAFYWMILNGLDKHMSYLRMSQYSNWYIGEDDQPIGAYTNLMNRFAPYLGANLNPLSEHYTPSVWVAMREFMYPICYVYAGCQTTTQWPVLGNFEFWLYQRDDVEGGQTIPETHVDKILVGNSWYNTALGLCGNVSGGPDGYPCYENVHNPDLPQLKEAFVIRRTDQATNNPYMFFDIDDGYVWDGVNGADFTITYWDHGNDKFRLLYDSTSGPKYARPVGSNNTWVQKGNTNEFRTVTFRVQDAKFANRLAGFTDFAIDSRSENGVNDGNEWIHLVDMRRYDPTVTPTPTPTSTPTPTPTATPAVGNLGGTAYVDSNGNQVLDPGEPTLGSVPVELQNGGGSVIQNTVTNSTGAYSFSNLNAGTYRVGATPPDGYFARPAQYEASVTGGADVAVDLAHYQFLRLYLPVSLKVTGQ